MHSINIFPMSKHQSVNLLQTSNVNCGGLSQGCLFLNSSYDRFRNEFLSNVMLDMFWLLKLKYSRMDWGRDRIIFRLFKIKLIFLGDIIFGT